MNLRDLHYVLAVANTLSFKAAADACHVSQPTLSMQIKKMEEFLGVQLFERTNKSVQITAAGNRIVDIARRIVQDEKHMGDLARALRDPEAGEFRLGAFPTLASYIFPVYVPALHKAFPKLQLLLIEEKTDILLEKLSTGKIDAALLALPVDDAKTTAKPLFDDPFLLAVGRDHPLAHKKSVHVADLTGHKLLLLEEGHCLREQALSICSAHGAGEEKSFRATSLETLRLMVQSPHSGFMTLMPSVAVSARDKLRVIPFAGQKYARRIGLVWRKADGRGEMMVKMAEKLIAARK
jgi:LysR family transcriptional regulator, hydrogen peroxide-inducible genes activator